jgi:hypothetical protein
MAGLEAGSTRSRMTRSRHCDTAPLTIPAALRLKSRECWNQQDGAGSLYVIAHLLPSAEAVTVARHRFNRRGEGTELLSQ